MTLTIFPDFPPVPGTTALCAPAGMLTALLPGSARFGKRSVCVWRFLHVFRAKNAEFSHFRLLHFFGIFLFFSCASLQQRGLCPNLRLEILVLWLCERFECVLAGLDRCSMFLPLAGAEFSSTGDF